MVGDGQVCRERWHTTIAKMSTIGSYTGSHKCMVTTIRGKSFSSCDAIGSRCSKELIGWVIRITGVATETFLAEAFIRHLIA